jgi:hypothetical protein
MIVKEKKKHNTSSLCVPLCTQSFLALLCVYVETKIRVSSDMKNGIWGFEEGMNVNE